MRIKLFLFVLLISLNSFSQKSTEEKRAEKNTKCKHENKYSIEERNSFYPFNKAIKIQLISFDDPEKIVNTIPISNRTIDNKQVKEFKFLSKEEINKLTDIIYNYGFMNDKFPKIMNESMCYNPRNAILFIDEQSKVFEFIEICFSCNKIELSSNEIRVWDECTEKIELLKKFFIHNSFEVGTKRE